MNISELSSHERLRQLGVDAVLFNTSEFLPSVNLRYLTGFTGSDATFLLSGSERHLFTDGRYKTQARQECPGLKLHVVRRKLDSIARTLKRLGIQKLGMESARVSFDFATRLGRKVPTMDLVPLARRFVENLRIRKTQEEKAKLARAAEIASRSCEQLLEVGVLGRSERVVAEDLEARFRANGAQGIAFDTIVAAAERSALPHARPTNKVIHAGELVLIDFGCRFDDYHSDETVTGVVGPPSGDQKKLHGAVYEAHMKAIECLKVGIGVKEVDATARRVLEKAGLGKYFLHGLGHGVGLEIHEPPHLSPLGNGLIEEGMVFTIEPGVYVEGVGGVRLESLVYMASTGPEVLSKMSKKLLTLG